MYYIMKRQPVNRCFLPAPRTVMLTRMCFHAAVKTGCHYSKIIETQNRDVAVFYLRGYI